MFSQQRAIETVYQGHKYRSRLEARWAIFFTTLNIEYRYEPEGFNLDGIRYLPDFFLPEQKGWIEIKPTLPTEDEREKAIRLCLSTEQQVAILAGDVWTDVECFTFYKFSETDEQMRNMVKEHCREGIIFQWLTRSECIGWDSQEKQFIGIDLSRGFQWSLGTWRQCSHCHNHDIKSAAWFFKHKSDCPAGSDELKIEPLIPAYTAARQARFEHGAK